MGTPGGRSLNPEPRFGLRGEVITSYQKELNKKYNEYCREDGHPYCFDYNGMGYCFCMEKTYPLGGPLEDMEGRWDRMMGGRGNVPYWYVNYLSYQDFHGDAIAYSDYSDSTVHW